MESHLLQMRGLKQSKAYAGRAPTESHLLQMRGLKLYTLKYIRITRCRIFYRCVD